MAAGAAGFAGAAAGLAAGLAAGFGGEDRIVGVHRALYKLSHKPLHSERARERATRTERADAAARERACRGVRGAEPLG